MRVFLIYLLANFRLLILLSVEFSSPKKPTDLIDAAVLPVVPESDTVVKELSAHEPVHKPHLGDGIEKVEELEGVEVEDVDVVSAPDLGVVLEDLIDGPGPRPGLALRHTRVGLPMAGEDFHPASFQQLPGET